MKSIGDWTNSISTPVAGFAYICPETKRSRLPGRHIDASHLIKVCKMSNTGDVPGCQNGQISLRLPVGLI
jgi:hypothetical protein